MTYYFWLGKDAEEFLDWDDMNMDIDARLMRYMEKWSGDFG